MLPNEGCIKLFLFGATQRGTDPTSQSSIDPPGCAFLLVTCDSSKVMLIYIRESTITPFNAGSAIQFWRALQVVYK